MFSPSKAAGGTSCTGSLATPATPTGLPELGHNSPTVAQSGQLDALVALERIGARLNFTRNDEIYAEGDSAECWYKVVSGLSGSASCSPMAGATSANSASAAIVSGVDGPRAIFGRSG